MKNLKCIYLLPICKDKHLKNNNPANNSCVNETKYNPPHAKKQKPNKNKLKNPHSNQEVLESKQRQADFGGESKLGATDQLGMNSLLFVTLTP